MRTNLRRLRRDDGRISLFLAVLAVGIIAMIGLAVDVGAKMRALERADNYAQEAARTGAQAIRIPDAVQGGAKRIDPAAAVAAANQYLATAGVTGTVTVGAGGTELTVTVTIREPTVALNIIGITSFDVTSTATATLLTG